MIDKKKVKELVLAVLVADSYSLGSHWIYDEKALLSLDIDWNKLNEPKALWHKNKSAGEFTHYGDQTIFLYEFLEDKKEFNAKEYTKYWFDKMQSYNGYIDSATKQTFENINQNIQPSGSNSSDLSIVSRIAPLLLVSEDKKEFLKNVEEFVKITHNSKEALNTSSFFARLLLEVLESKEIFQSTKNLESDTDSKTIEYIKAGVDSKNKNTFEAIREFGPACDIDGGVQGVIHLLSKYDSLKQMLICNAKAGGETSARAMLATLIFMAQDNKTLTEIPPSWLAIKATII